jgi:hypothetical protein
MKKQTLALIVLALVLGALPASAAHRSNENENEDRGRRYDREWTRNVESNHEAKVAVLAERLDGATSELFRNAADRRRKRSYRDWRAVHTLQRLERGADRYHARVERRGADSRSAEAAYQELVRAYRAATACRGDLRNSRRVRRDFERVDALMAKLDRRIAKLDRKEERRVSKYDRHALSREWRNYVAFRFDF